MLTHSVAATVLVVVLTACGDGAAGVDASTPAPDAAPDAALPPSRDVDILIVIDNSGSMGEEQTAWANSFQSRFEDVLEARFGTLPNLHIGIVSSNVGVGGFQITGCGGDGDDGRLLNQARYACTPPAGYYISNIEGVPNYTGTLHETFSCIARLGVDGCGFEQHFESMKRALDGSNPQNQGFLRPEAYLAVIFLTDEDDCSASDSAVYDPAQTAVTDPLGPLSSFRCTEFGIQCDGLPITRTPAAYANCAPRDPSQYMQHPRVYVEFLKSLKPDPRMIVVGGSIGNPTPVSVTTDTMGKPALEPSCSSDIGEAHPGVRLQALVDEFQNGRVASICQADLSDGLFLMANVIADAMQAPNP